jgi:hypothetical protein
MRQRCHNRAVVFSYSGDAPSAVHKVRLMIADTRERDAAGAEVYIFDDEELQTLLDLHSGNLYAAAAAALRARMADLARAYSITAGSKASGGISVSADTPLQALEKLADRYEQRAAQADGPELLDWSAQDLNDLEAMLPRTYHRADGESVGVELD